MLIAVWAYEFALGDAHARIELHSSNEAERYVFAAGIPIKTQNEGGAVVFTFRNRRCVATLDANAWTLKVDGVLAPRLPTVAVETPADTAEKEGRPRVLFHPVQVAVVGVVAMVVLVVTTKGCVWARPPTWAVDWKPLDAADGRVSATMPAESVLVDRSFGSDASNQTVRSFVAEVRDVGIFSVGSMRASNGASYFLASRSLSGCNSYIDWTISALMHDIKNASIPIVSSHGGTLLANGLDCTASGTADHDWEFSDLFRAKTVRAGPVAFAVHLRFLGDTMYVATSVVARPFALEPDVKRFWDSIKLPDE